MILNDKITIKVNIYNIKYYSKNKIGDYIEITPINLPKGSGIILDVQCEYCGFKKKLSFRKYLKNTKDLKVKYSCSNYCSVIKYKETCLSRYGVDNAYKLEENKDKMRKTCESRYGFDNPLKNKLISDKMVSTKEEKGFYSSNRSEYSIYRNRCRTLTRLNRINLLKSWNGYDYYDNEFILEYMKLDPLHSLYPTVDHKIPILEGFKNNITPEEISDISNLCVTKRKINSSYGGRKK